MTRAFGGGGGAAEVATLLVSSVAPSIVDVAFIGRMVVQSAQQF